jgi:ABC-type bacteriocin/lantibiotic exporter with double-glycine peptidase domain
MVKRLAPEHKWFLSQLRPFLQTHLLSIFLIFLASLIFLLDPLILKWLIDVVLPKKDARLLMLGVACIASVYVCQLSCYAAGGILSFQTVQKLVYSIRLRFLEQINRLSADFHETVPLGEKLYRMEQDVDQVAEIGSTMVPTILQTAFTAIFVLGTMFVLNRRLTCVLVPLMPLFLILSNMRFVLGALPTPLKNNPARRTTFFKNTSQPLCRSSSFARKAVKLGP